LESEVSQALPKSFPNTRERKTDGLTEGKIPLRTESPIVDLPPPDTKRWVVRRKAAVVAAVRSGVIDLAEACQRYGLSNEEFFAWERGIENFGVPGLRATRLQIYYNAPRTTQAKPRY
jgi:hypothetical protein